jgi:hypothetical protein
MWLFFNICNNRITDKTPVPPAGSSIFNSPSALASTPGRAEGIKNKVSCYQQLLLETF